MFSTKIWRNFSLFFIMVALLTACAAPASLPATEEEQNQAEAGKPTKVKIAFFYCGTLDEAWSQAIVQGTENVKKSNPPQGLDIEYKYFEKIPVDEFENFIRNVVESNEYDINWIHDGCAGADPIDRIVKDYPDKIFPVTASNYHVAGGNTYWIQVYAHEPAYLAGIIAGMMTKTNIIGAVAAFPYANVNHLLNAYIEGAKSVNPDIKAKVAYIESWYDPVKAKETAIAQINSGADIMFGERYGVHEAAREAGILAFGSQADIHDLAPDTVVTSPMFYWEPYIIKMIELWYDNKVNGTPYAASSTEPTSILMKEGGSGLTPFYDFEQKLPKEVLDKVNSVKQDILDGKFVVPLNLAEVKSD